MPTTISQHQATLLHARKLYSHAARAVEHKIRSQGLLQTFSEQVVGIGVAADWVRRAAEMAEIRFVGDNLNKSRHSESFTEVVRFGFSWFGLNAIFTRPAILGLFCAARHMSEFEQFKEVYGLAPVPSHNNALALAHRILLTSTTPRLPGEPAGTQVTILDAVCRKYLPTTPKGKTAQSIAQSAKSNNLLALDLPTLIYAFRNWSVHGNALNGSFGSRRAFLDYALALEVALAEVHVNVASALLAKL